MKKLLALFAVCSVAAAMVPRERRALNEDEESRAPPPTSATTTTTIKPKEVCAAQTPCGWAIYHPVTQAIQTKIRNSYCNCGEGQVCTETEDDKAVNTYMFHCRLPSENDSIFDNS